MLRSKCSCEDSDTEIEVANSKKKRVKHSSIIACIDTEKTRKHGTSRSI